MESDINKNLTDEQIDELIRQSFRRQQVVDEINISVMKQLRHETHRRNILKWVKIAGFAFGLPMVLLLFGWLLWSSVSQQYDSQIYIFNFHLPIFICLFLPVATMIYVCWYAIKHFSLDKV